MDLITMQSDFPSAESRLRAQEALTTMLYAQVHEVKYNTDEIKADVQELKNDNAEIKADIQILKVDVQELKTDM